MRCQEPLLPISTYKQMTPGRMNPPRMETSVSHRHKYTGEPQSRSCGSTGDLEPHQCLNLVHYGSQYRFKLRPQLHKTASYVTLISFPRLHIVQIKITFKKVSFCSQRKGFILWGACTCSVNLVTVCLFLFWYILIVVTDAERGENLRLITQI